VVSTIDYVRPKSEAAGTSQPMGYAKSGSKRATTQLFLFFLEVASQLLQIPYQALLLKNKDVP
jgi:hypothetical protein